MNTVFGIDNRFRDDSIFEKKAVDQAISRAQTFSRFFDMLNVKFSRGGTGTPVLFPAF